MRRGLVISLVIAAGTAALAAPAGFTVQDLVAMDRLSELASSSAHSRLAFTVSTLDREANRRRSDIWTVDARDGGAPVRLTADPASDTSPVWSPDGQAIYFLSSRSGSSQVWRMSGSQAGEATQVTKYPLDVGAFGLSPDGRQLAVALEVFVDCADLSCTADRVAAAEKRKATGRLYDSLLFRHWDTWKDGRRSHLFVAPVDMFAKTPNAAAAIDVMKGMDADGPSKPFGGAEEFTFTPDSRGLVFTARDAGREEAWSTNLDLWVSPIDGSAQAAQPDRGEQGHRRRPGVLARRHAARLPRDGAGRLRGRPLRDHARELGRPQRAAPRPRRGVGSLAERARLVDATARRSTRRPRTSGSSRCSPSTSRPARRRRCSRRARSAHRRA